MWAAVSFVFIAFHQPLHHNHLRRSARALATPAAIGLVALARARPARGWAALGVIAFLLVAGYVQQHRRLAVADIPEQPELVAAAETLRRVTRPDDIVVSDQPIVPFLAHRVVWGPLVDTANLRFQTGSLTDVEGTARTPRVVTSRRSWRGAPSQSEMPFCAPGPIRYPQKIRVGDLKIYLRS